MTMDIYSSDNNPLHVYKTIEAEIEEVDKKYEEMLRFCEQVFVDIFEKFGIIEIAFSSYIEKWAGGARIKFTSLKYFDFEVPGKRFQLSTPKYGYNFDIMSDDMDQYNVFWKISGDYAEILKAVLDSINEYLAVGLPVAEWPVGLKSDAERTTPSTERVTAELTVTRDDFVNLIKKKYEIIMKALELIKRIMKEYGYTKIIIPKEHVSHAIREFEFLTDLVTIREDGKLRFYHDQNHMFPAVENINEGGYEFDNYIFPMLLKSVCESIEYYQAHPEELPLECKQNPYN